MGDYEQGLPVQKLMHLVDNIKLHKALWPELPPALQVRIVHGGKFPESGDPKTQTQLVLQK